MIELNSVPGAIFVGLICASAVCHLIGIAAILARRGRSKE
jgi:hypothetical protein